VLVAWILQGFLIQYLLAPLVQRPRPFGVELRGDWYAWALPSEQLAALVVALVGILYGLVPEGRWRQTGKWIATVLVALIAVAHLYLGVEAPTDILVGVALGVAIPLLGFRWFAPSQVFPDHLPPGAQRPPGRRRGTRARHPPSLAGPARPRGRRSRTVRAGRVGRLYPPAHHRQGRPQQLVVR
jgi:membrane-associated phospholipid phosphatase